MLSNDIEALVSLFDIFLRSILRQKSLQVFPLLFVFSVMISSCYKTPSVHDVWFMACSYAIVMIH